MPRKVYGADYDEDDFYDYEDHDYDYDYDLEETRELAGSEQEHLPSGIWSCPICTYDNDESLSACDICGVLRNPLVNSHSNTDKKSDDSICKNCGVSKMAKSLFASLPHRTPKLPVLVQLQKEAMLKEEGNRFLEIGDTPKVLHEFYEASSSRYHRHTNIESFKFDVPSPDDIVSNGLGASKMGSKGNSTTVSGKKSTVDVQTSTKKFENMSGLMPKGRKDIKSKAKSSVSPSGAPTERINNLDQDSRHEDASDKQSSNKVLDGLSTSISGVGHGHGDKSSSSGHIAGAQNIASSLHEMSLNVRTEPSNNSKVRKATSDSTFKSEKWMHPNEADNMSQLNLAIVGHVDSGKSTLSGRLLHLLGRISQKEMHKYEKEAKLQGKGSFAYAFALDESSEERERGITMTVAVAYFDSKRYHVVVLDSPGHKDFVPNMISGATQADAALLIIDASVGAFEAGIDSTKGQTREHAQLIRSFGVDQVIVVVNKMDTVEYSKDRFDIIKQELGTFLRSCGFKDSSLTWIPLSAMENQNLVAAPSDTRLLSWYKGPHLLDAIDSLKPPTRDFSRPLLMPVCDVIKSTSTGQISACGKVEAGAVKSGLKVMVMPSGEIGTVRNIERDSKASSVARAGENVAVTLHGIDGSSVMAGDVLCHPDFPVAVAKRLEIKVLVLDFATPILIGSQLEFYVHHAKEAVRVVKILSLLDPKTGKVTKRAPRCLTAKQSALVEVELHGPVCVEEFSSCKALGRVFLRSLGRTIAVGIVTKIIREQH